MPIFEYRCPKCGLVFERIVPSATTEVACPKCGAVKTEKLISSFAFRGGRSGGGCGPGTPT